MSIRYVLQGRRQCGQALVAVLLGGIPLSDAVALTGKSGRTGARDIDAALRRGSTGKVRLSARTRSISVDGAPAVWLVAVKLKPGRRGWHWALVRFSGVDADVVWPTMYPQHVYGFADQAKASAFGWPPQARITQAYRVLGVA